MFGRSKKTNLAFHEVMLTKFGEKMSKVDIYIVSHSILELIEQKCLNLRTIGLTNVSRMPNLKGLKKVSLTDVRNITKECFITFIENNPQLEKLTYYSSIDDIDLIECLENRLPKLNIFDWCPLGSDPTINISKIALPSLEKLRVDVCESLDIMHILHIIDCNGLKHLDISECYEADDELITQICKFKSLSRLDMDYCSTSMDQITTLAENLFHLTKFSTKIDESEMNSIAFNQIFSMLLMFPKLKNLKVFPRDADEQFSHPLQMQTIYKFRARFLNIILTSKWK